MTEQKILCTVSVLTRNSADVLPRALASVRAFDEILILDGNSTDRTRNIAKEVGATVIAQDRKYLDSDCRIVDFSGVRNQALEAASNDWFLYLDADEEVTPELIQEVREVVLREEPAAYWVPRKYVFKDKVIECATTYPNRQMRFFHKQAVKGFVKEIHERVEAKETASILFLKEHMHVPIDSNIIALRKKWDRYIILECRRRDSISFLTWVKIALGLARVSILYFARLPLVMLCKSRLPFSFELERHRYHVRLARALLRLYLKN